MIGYISQMMKWLCCYTLLLFCALNGFGQNKFHISGTVKDGEGKPLPGAGVYLSGYKTATVSDGNGQFMLTNIAAGNYDVLIQMMGYLPLSKNVLISDKPVKIEVVLKDNTIQLKEVVIKADPNRARYLEMFREYFIGKTPNAEKCKILNPQVIQTEYDKERKILRVTANEFLLIENKSLGYRIKYLLEYFERDFTENVVYYAGHPYFEELPGSGSKRRSWFQKREIAYAGSSQHFFRSLYQNTTKNEGFIIHKMMSIPNRNRLPDSLINASIKRLYKPGNTIVRIGPGFSSPLNDSISYWLKQRAVPKSLNVLDRSEVLTDTLVAQLYKDVKTMNFNGDLYVINTRERESEDYTAFSGHSITRPLDVPNYQISTLHILKGPIHFYANGGIFNPKSVLLAGFWAYEKIADMVPMDYIPNTKEE